MSDARLDPAIWNDWHPIAAVDDLDAARPFRTRLLGHDLVVHSGAGTGATSNGGRVHLAVRHGLVFACLGEPVHEVVDFPLCAEPDRWIVGGGAIQVAVSGLRAVENFLDLGHLGFVHAGYLGQEPHNEIVPYRVTRRRDGGIVATECRVYQPLASPVATAPIDVDYVYEVLRPYCVVLYKTNPAQPARQDFIALLLQPVDEEHCIAHSLLAYLRDDITPAVIRSFMQLIFCQDKPILENQQPKRLPLYDGAEFAVRSDASSAAYRSWLRECGVRYGAV